MFGRLTGSNDNFSDPELVIVPVGLDGAAGAPTVIALDGFDDLDGYPPRAGSGHPTAGGSPSGGARRGVGGRHANRRDPPLARPPADRSRVAPRHRRTRDRRRQRHEDGVSTPISIYSVSTGELRQLGSVQAGHLTWSPDGTTIAFARVSRVGSGDDEHDSTSLWLVDADGTNERLLVADPFNANHGIGPVWSPTGDRIAYQRVIGCCENHEVVLVNVADGTETVIEPPQTGGPNGPVRWYPWIVTWSPDGTTLLYNGVEHGPRARRCARRSR